MAGDMDVDLVEIAATANPPVCRLMDYGKFKYQEQKARRGGQGQAEDHRDQGSQIPSGHGRRRLPDQDAQPRRFIAEDGDKGKVTLRFRGREITHQEIGMRLLERIRDELADVAMVEQLPKLEGPADDHGAGPEKKVKAGFAEFAPVGLVARRITRLATPEANKRAGRLRHRPLREQQRRSSHAQDEDQEQREKRFRVRPVAHRQARSGVQAPHPDQEDHEEQAPAARRRERARNQHGPHGSNVAVRRPVTPRLKTQRRKMPRVKRGVTARARHKKVLALAKGFRGRRKNVFRIAKQAVMKAGQIRLP